MYLVTTEMKTSHISLVAGVLTILLSGGLVKIGSSTLVKAKNDSYALHKLTFLTFIRSVVVVLGRTDCGGERDALKVVSLKSRGRGR